MENEPRRGLLLLLANQKVAKKSLRDFTAIPLPDLQNHNLDKLTKKSLGILGHPLILRGGKMRLQDPIDWAEP